MSKLLQLRGYNCSYVAVTRQLRGYNCSIASMIWNVTNEMGKVGLTEGRRLSRPPQSCS